MDYVFRWLGSKFLTGDDRAVNTFEVTISDLKQLTDLMKTIERLKGVYSVERV